MLTRDIKIVAAELEEDERLRISELILLENICESLNDEAIQNRMRKSMLVMLYAQLEGFTKFALEVYKRHVSEANLKCGDVQSELAVSAFSDVFSALKGSDRVTKKFLPKELHETKEDLRTFAIQKTLVDRASSFLDSDLMIPEKYIDLESNLKPIVLKKNLFRLGLEHNQFSEHDAVLQKLVGLRNNIAHGDIVAGVDSKDYDDMRGSVLKIVQDIRLKIIDAIQTRRYLKSWSKSPIL
jgi:RiboL-PSP-HEPN